MKFNGVIMDFHIDRGLIFESFENDCGCPLCAIEKIVEQNICKELLADGCMDDDVRMLVNSNGFCEKHFNLLFSMPSKLSLALQVETRLKTLKNKAFVKPKNVWQAKKQARILKGELKTCIVCSYVQSEMIKYYKTIAKIYDELPNDWHEKLLNTNGFCFKHYSELLLYAQYAGTKSKKYLNDLFSAQEKRVNKADELLNRFCTRHDYRNIGKPLGEAENALPHSSELFYGIKSDKNKK